MSDPIDFVPVVPPSEPEQLPVPPPDVAELPPNDEIPAAPPTLFMLLVDEAGIVTQRIMSNAMHPDATLVGEDVYHSANPHRSKLVDGAIVAFEPPPLPEPVPAVVSDRQLFQALAVSGLIGKDETLAAVMTGTIPAAMAAFIDTLPADDQFSARMLLCGATQFERSNPLVTAFGSAQTPPMDGPALDYLWRTAAAL